MSTSKYPPVIVFLTAVSFLEFVQIYTQCVKKIDNIIEHNKGYCGEGKWCAIRLEENLGTVFDSIHLSSLILALMLL